MVVLIGNHRGVVSKLNDLILVNRRVNIGPKIVIAQ